VKRGNIFFVALLTIVLEVSCLGQARSYPSGVCVPPIKPAIESLKPNYTITITPPSGPLSLKSPLLVEMYYTNTTTSDRIYMDVVICSTCVSERILLTKDGKEVDTTPWQRVVTGRGSPSDWKLYPSRSGNSRSFCPAPGAFWKVNLDLRAFYNITEPGQYGLTASRTQTTKDGRVVVKSNTVTLDIVP